MDESCTKGHKFLILWIVILTYITYYLFITDPNIFTYQIIGLVNCYLTIRQPIINSEELNL